MRGGWPVENSKNDPPEYSPAEEAAALKAAEDRLMRKKQAGLLVNKMRPPSVEKPDPKPQVEKPEKADKPKKRVRVVRDADGAITHFEAD